MGKIHVWVERQVHLAICTLHPSHKMFWMCCYDGMVPLIEQELENGECIEADLEVSNVKKVGFNILSSRSEPKEKIMIKSKKLKMGLGYAFVAPALAIVAIEFGLPAELIATCLWVGCVIVVANMVTHAITDIAHINCGVKK